MEEQIAPTGTGCEDSLAEAVAGGTEEVVSAEPTEKPELTDKMIRNLRRVYFTVRHDISHPCGHKLDRINQPNSHCEYCWYNWFNSHGELVKTADEAFRNQGKAFLVSMRGKTFVKYFLRFMSTVAQMEREKARLEALEKEINEQIGKVASLERSGSGVEQEVRDEGDVPTQSRRSEASGAEPAYEPAIG